jgi:hypothetical protein
MVEVEIRLQELAFLLRAQEKHFDGSNTSRSSEDALRGC